MSKLQNPVHMAIIGAAHGIKGEVRVKPFTEDPLALGDYRILYDRDGQAYEIESIRAQKTVVVIRFKNVIDRNSAERLNGINLYVERDALPDDLDEEEFYHTDLIGLDVRLQDGAILGKVSSFFNFGAGDLMEIKQHGQKPVLVPFTKAAIPVVDVKGGFVVADEAAAGLIEDEEDKDVD